MLIKRICALALSLLLSLSLLLCTSCSLTEDNSPTVLSLGDHKITSAMYNYWASVNKAQYLYQYSDVSDTPDFWNSEIREGQTAAEYLDSITLDSIKAYLVASMLFDEYGLSFSDEEMEGITNYISDLIKEYADGNESTLNTALKAYGIDLNILKKLYVEEEKPAKIYNHLYSKDGISPLTDEDYEAFYQENYVHFQLIYINNMYCYSLDDDGNKITDDDGYYVTEELCDEEKAEKDALVKAVTDSLSQGGDFDELYKEYSEVKSYENGYYYSAADSYDDQLYYRLIIEAEGIEVGEYTVFEADAGTYIIKKLELCEGDWNKKSNSDFFGENGESLIDLTTEKAYRDLIESYFDKITVDEEAIREFSVAKVTPCYSF